MLLKVSLPIHSSPFTSFTVTGSKSPQLLDRAHQYGILRKEKQLIFAIKIFKYTIKSLFNESLEKLGFLRINLKFSLEWDYAKSY
jgi:hypothetical protein